MYSYIPRESLLKGVSLGELYFSQLEKENLLEPDFVRAGLEADTNNIRFVPLDFFIANKKNQEFSLMNLLKKNYQSIVLLEFFERIKSAGCFSAELNTLFNKKNIAVKLFGCAFLTNSDAETNKNFFDAIPKDSLLLTDEEYLLSVLNALNNKYKNESYFYDFLSYFCNMLPAKFMQNKNVAAYAFLSNDLNNLPDEIANNPDKMVELLEFTYSKVTKITDREFMYLMDLNWSHQLKSSKKFVKFMLGKNNKCSFDLSELKNIMSVELFKDLGFMLEISKEQYALGKDIIVSDYFEEYSDNNGIKFIIDLFDSHRETMTWYVNNSMDFFFHILYYSRNDLVHTLILQKMLAVINLKDAGKNFIKHLRFCLINLPSVQSTMLEIPKTIGKDKKDIEIVIEGLKKKFLPDYF